jgi:hypothetical protein
MKILDVDGDKDSLLGQTLARFRNLLLGPTVYFQF